MHKSTIALAVSFYSLTILTGCGGGVSNTSAPITSPTPTAPVATNSLGISDVPENIAKTYSKALKFNRYTSVTAPNGKKIGIVAQDGINKNQIIRARSILAFYLTNVPNSQYGSDKSFVANAIANSGAKLLLLNGVDDGTNPAANLDGQPLYYGEMQVEGGNWYINQNYEHRDASYEEILHFVHDFGIGVDQNASFSGVLPNYQAEIRAAQINGLSQGLWGIGSSSWIKELTAENSLTQEYLAAIIDSYYGLWGASTDSKTHGMNGIYVGKTRVDTAKDDPLGYALVDKFFSPVITYNARIDETFVGTFSLAYNASLPYTNHSQYLKDITLTGGNSSNVHVNQLDNNIAGNSGINTVIFTGVLSEYDISVSNNMITVKDLRDARDGTNTLAGVEKLQFSNSTIDAPSS